MSKLHASRGLSLIMGMCLVLSFISDLHAAETDLIGKRIYLKGIGEKGQKIIATGVSDTRLAGAQAACANCHRRSGYGTSESGRLIQPITGHFLYQSRDFHYRELKQNMSRPITRPAYTRQSLHTAILGGVGADGKPLDTFMPRYRLSRSELTHVINYLESLGGNTAPGVGNDDIHIATVITPDITDQEELAMLATLNTYIDTRNAATRSEVHRAKNSPWHKSWHYESYRKWKLHVWRLKGNADTWNDQLQQYYRRQPVFAGVAGIGKDVWQPVDDFFERNEIPYLLPTIEVPGQSPEHYYSVYYSRGIQLEAEVIAAHLESSHMEKGVTLIQLVDGQVSSQVAAQRLNQQLHDSQIKVQQISGTQPAEIRKQLEAAIKQAGAPVIVVSWLQGSVFDLTPLRKDRSIQRIYTSSTRLQVGQISDSPNNDLYIVHRYALPGKLDFQLIRAHQWVRQHKVTPVIDRVTANTYLAATMLNMALKHIRSNFSREYLIERVEHMFDSIVFNSVYPHLSLGPDQRFASKGAFIIGPLHRSSDFTQAKAGKWIIP